MEEKKTIAMLSTKKKKVNLVRIVKFGCKGIQV